MPASLPQHLYTLDHAKRSMLGSAQIQPHDKQKHGGRGSGGSGYALEPLKHFTSEGREVALEDNRALGTTGHLGHGRGEQGVGHALERGSGGRG